MAERADHNAPTYRQERKITGRLPKPHLPKSRTDDLVETAFQATWITLSNDPYRDRNKDDNLKTRLRGKLAAMCAAGMVDTELMRKIALECFRATPAAH